LFLPLAMTIAFALTMSFFVSRTVTPLLCLHLLRPASHRAEEGIIAAAGRALERLDHGYARAIRWVLGHRLGVVGGSLGLFAASLLLAGQIGTEFFPEADEAQLSVTYKTPIGTRVERTEEVSTRVEEAVARVLAPAKGRDGEAAPLYTTMISDS